jgi:glyoxylase-like metal-dependent hydrolase (beta-lactamase superfamily II)
MFSAALHRPAHYAATGVRVDKFDVGPYENNAFVVRCTETGEGVLIDAANEHDRLEEICRHAGVRRVLTTHGHWDHIQAVVPLRDAGLDVAIGADDTFLLPTYDTLMGDDEVIEVGRLRLRTIHNPGHTPGSMSFSLEGSPVLFSGDTLFPGGPGNTSYEGGDFPTIIRSIEDRLFATLPPETIVMPGHGDDTTIGAERPHLQEWIDRGW